MSDESGAYPPVAIGSLCSGYGGLELGLITALGRGEVAWHVEYDKNPSAVLEARFPGVPNYGDVTMTDWRSVEPVDWITAGYPCQPFSAAGKRQGEADERHLWPAVADALRVLRPRSVLLENVAGHLSLGFGQVLGDLAALGYDARWTCLRASDAGAPHGRLRVFVVATDSAERGRGRSAGVKRGQRTTERLAPAVADAADNGHERRGPTRRRGDGPSDSRDAAAHPNPAEQPREHAQQHGAAAPAGSGGSAWGPYRLAIARWERVLGRPAPSPVDDRRRLNPRFSEWLMGLPAGWVTDVLGRAPALKCIGNGVVPQQAALAVSVLHHNQAVAA